MSADKTLDWEGFVFDWFMNQEEHTKNELRRPEYLLAEAVAGFVREKTLEKKKCLWQQDEYSGGWDTACGNSWIFEYKGPKENKAKFCPFCGSFPVVERLKAKKDGDSRT